jgi:hypothetical protein
LRTENITIANPVEAISLAITNEIVKLKKENLRMVIGMFDMKHSIYRKEV